MPSLQEKRGVRLWRAAVMVDGKMRRKWFPDDSKASMRAAAAWEEETRKQLLRQQSQTSTACPCLLYEWGRRHLDWAMGFYADKTYVERKAELSAFLGAKPAGIAADNYSSVTAEEFAGTPGEAMEYLKDQREARSGNAANKARKNLATAWDWGKANVPGWPQGGINPFREQAKYPEERQPRYVPPREHVEAVDAHLRGAALSPLGKVLDDARLQDWVMFGVFRFALARRGEVFRLAPEDVNLVGSTVRMWSRKTRGGNLVGKWVPMVPALRERLALWLKVRPIKDKENLFLVLDQYEFCKGYYGKPFTSQQHGMERWCERAEIVPAFDRHSIRHRGALDLYESGVTVSTIQRILRHSSPTTTERYLESLGCDLANTREAMERAFGAGKVIRLPVRETA
ncbi:tyrosine-type recombinase/integrase [Desulfocurvibacter africanus]|uniref:Integrase family protein n=1 Tax=Desulfocurvibacter africanus subsp. africanus str. Walvis Bay TaxID=690850 RepID=F3Z342_DESAF|nr:site-specific integrase [Desulfocurvibacter africanus]EGJ50286.1 integrase family protein [Desulfocurvibacter africanus subsp. africanus str. Walvis Bay]